LLTTIWNDDSKYPKVGYQVFYRMDIKEIYDFEAGYESSERIFVDLDQVSEYYHDWHELYDYILNYAANKKIRD
jgi:8-oxo-dGTP diphosphatase